MRDASRLSSALLFEVAVLEDIGRGADQAESDLFVAGVTQWKRGSLEHDDFMRLAVVAAVNDFIDSGFLHGIAGAKLGSVSGGTMSVIGLIQPIRCAGLAQRSSDTWGCDFVSL